MCDVSIVPIMPLMLHDSIPFQSNLPVSCNLQISPKKDISIAENRRSRLQKTYTDELCENSSAPREEFHER